MALISQPGSDYQIASISLDAGYTRDLILMLTDVHAVLDHLYLDGTQPEITPRPRTTCANPPAPTPCPPSSTLSARSPATSAAPNAKRSTASRPTRPHARQPAAIPPPASNRHSPLPQGGARPKENSYPSATECGAT
jgi:hypothetical protein